MESSLGSDVSKIVNFKAGEMPIMCKKGAWADSYLYVARTMGGQGSV